jgi:hypothetical protein
MTYGEPSEEDPRFTTSLEQAPQPQPAFLTVRPDYFEISLMNLLFLY